jgi:hypothetical protein
MTGNAQKCPASYVVNHGSTLQVCISHRFPPRRRAEYGEASRYTLEGGMALVLTEKLAHPSEALFCHAYAGQISYSTPLVSQKKSPDGVGWVGR